MKPSHLFSLALGITLIPSLAFAVETKTTTTPLVVSEIQTASTTPKREDLLTTCKKTAETKRDAVVKSSLKEYVAASQNITDQAKSAFQKISWYIASSYRTESKRIQEEKKQAMKPITIKVNSNRKAAKLTYEAEVALCEKMYGSAPQATSTKKK